MVLEGRYQRQGIKGKKKEIIFCDGVMSPHKIFRIDGDVEKKGTLVDGADVAFLPVVMNMREAINMRIASVAL